MEQKKYHEDYVPSDDILSKYADILVNFSLNQGQGLKPGEVVNLRLRAASRPMRTHIEKYIIQAGGKLIDNIMPINEFDANIYKGKNIIKLQEEYAELSQSIIQQSNHEMLISADDYSNALEKHDLELFSIYEEVKNNYNRIRGEKRDIGKLGYSLSYYPTPSMATAAGLTMKEYRQEVIHACFLNEVNPINKRKEVFSQIHHYRDILSEMKIQNLHIVGEDIDLHIQLGSDRKWLGGTGRNMPSYEIFISPDWRGTEGWIRFSEPLYKNGKLIDGVELTFQSGIVTKAIAKTGMEFLYNFFKIKNFDKIGEFSLTDKRFSRINKFMANGLYDENRGGKFGNTHIALGDSYKDSYDGDHKTLTQKDFEEKGFNSSILHIDIISTTDRIVTAKLENGEEKIIYQNGQFTLD